MRTRRSKTETSRAGPHPGNSRLALLRFAVAVFVALTMSFMPLAMSAGLAMAQPAPATLTDMGHCADKHGTSPDKQTGGMANCAVACAAVQPTAPLMTTDAGHARQILEAQPSTPLAELRPDVTSPPPRLFPEA